jgi:hypothetical protein
MSLIGRVVGGAITGTLKIEWDVSWKSIFR